jgi:hypothetical protein
MEWIAISLAISVGAIVWGALLSGKDFLLNLLASLALLGPGLVITNVVARNWRSNRIVRELAAKVEYPVSAICRGVGEYLVMMGKVSGADLSNATALRDVELSSGEQSPLVKLEQASAAVVANLEVYYPPSFRCPVELGPDDGFELALGIERFHVNFREDFFSIDRAVSLQAARSALDGLQVEFNALVTLLGTWAFDVKNRNFKPTVDIDHMRYQHFKFQTSIYAILVIIYDRLSKSLQHK